MTDDPSLAPSVSFVSCPGQLARSPLLVPNNSIHQQIRRPPPRARLRPAVNKMVGLQTGVLLGRLVSVVAAIAALLVFNYNSDSLAPHFTALGALYTMLCGHFAGNLALLIQLGHVFLGLPALPQQLLPCLGLLLLDGVMAVCMFGIAWSGVSLVEHTVRHHHHPLATCIKIHVALGAVAGQSASVMAILEALLAGLSF